MMFGVVPSASGPLAVKLLQQSVDKDRQRRRSLKMRAEMARLAQESASKAKAAIFAADAALAAAAMNCGAALEYKRRDILAKWFAHKEPPLPPLTGREIQEQVAVKYGVTVLDLQSKSRRKALTAVRHEAMYRIAKETGLSFPNIGKIFGGRDHTTALHGVAKHAERNGLPPARTPKLRGGEA